jgi:hypothetical protein
MGRAASWIDQVTPTNGRTPKTGEGQLRVLFANGMVSRHTYTARQLIWKRRGWDFDVVAVEKA